LFFHGGFGLHQTTVWEIITCCYWRGWRGGS